MAELEPQIRAYSRSGASTRSSASGRFDFIADLGAQLPMRTIGMLLGIPEVGPGSDPRAVATRVVRSEPGRTDEARAGFGSGEMFAEYIDWRAEHPVRRPHDRRCSTSSSKTRPAPFAASPARRSSPTRRSSPRAGNETTGHLIAWTGKVLADHPDQRRELVDDPSLIPSAIEEMLRFESPAQQFARSVTDDVELHGTTVPEGSVMMAIMASANRDDRRFPDGDRFDIHRTGVQHFSFGHGIHYCLGAALARLEGRVALEEILQRFPEWEIDIDNARMASSSTLRGWDTLPAFIR